MNIKQLSAQLKHLIAGQDQVRGEVARLTEELQAVRDENETLKETYALLERRHADLQTDYEALVASSQTLIADRDRLQRRVAELEAANASLTNMLWGRRSERRIPEDGQLQLWQEETPGPEEQAVIVAQAQANEAADEELLRQFAARRKRQRRERSEVLPEHLERREKILDLSSPFTCRRIASKTCWPLAAGRPVARP